MRALRAITGEGRVHTPDLGGKSTTTELTQAVIEKAGS
jgi:isocitrate/isopropylmalate dehydrogenase